jgi:ligand-binding sensor domain-containing protein
MIYHLPIDKNEAVEELFFDKNDRLWIVKRSMETTVFDVHPENSSQYLQPVFRFEKEQIIGSPRSFVIDKKGIIWIGTRDDGVVGYEQKNNQLKQLYHFYSGNGLPINFVTALACDSSNNIIVGTQTGLDRIVFDSSTSYRVENLSKSSNFLVLSIKPGLMQNKLMLLLIQVFFCNFLPLQKQKRIIHRNYYRRNESECAA